MTTQQQRERPTMEKSSKRTLKRLGLIVSFTAVCVGVVRLPEIVLTTAGALLVGGALLWVVAYCLWEVTGNLIKE